MTNFSFFLSRATTQSSTKQQSRLGISRSTVSSPAKLNTPNTRERSLSRFSRPFVTNTFQRNEIVQSQSSTEERIYSIKSLKEKRIKFGVNILPIEYHTLFLEDNNDDHLHSIEPKTKRRN